MKIRCAPVTTSSVLLHLAESKFSDDYVYPYNAECLSLKMLNVFNRSTQELLEYNTGGQRIVLSGVMCSLSSTLKQWSILLRPSLLRAGFRRDVENPLYPEALSSPAVPSVFVHIFQVSCIVKIKFELYEIARSALYPRSSKVRARKILPDAGTPVCCGSCRPLAHSSTNCLYLPGT